jgi:PAS domain S-box-containing protein
MIKKVKENFTAIALSLVIVLVLINISFTVYNRSVMMNNNELKAQTEEVKLRLNTIFENILRRIDLGLRGYALTKNKQLLDPYDGAIKDNVKNLRALDSLFIVQKLDTTREQFFKIKEGIDAYINTSKEMKALAEAGNLEEFVRILNEDKGYDLWQLFKPFYEKTLTYEDALIKQATEDYLSAQNRNVVFQVILIIVSLPTLVFVILRLGKEEKSRRKIITDFDQSIRYYLYNSGEEMDSQSNAQTIISGAIENLKKASQFVKEIATGNYNVSWQGLTEGNLSFNNENLAGDLLKMRDEMRKIKAADEKRLWSTEGLSKFSELIRNNQNQKEKLLDEIVRYLTKYLAGNQSSLFVLNEDESEGEVFLELGACYAYDKKKYLQKRVEIGDGMVGQVYLEGNTLVLKEVPADYVQITSGLGEATPRFLVIIPLKYNEKVQAILEMASFREFDEHQISFLEKAGEFVASAIHAATTSEKTAQLLKQSQEQAELMHAQEEELRQNMEEMQATQEGTERKMRESEGLINTVIGILDQLPQKIFLKDEAGKMVIANSVVAKAHNMTVSELIGKSDFDFVDAKTAQDWRNQELEIIRKGRETYIFKETLNGQTKLLESTKMAFHIDHLNQTGLLGIQTDITEISELRKLAN